MKVEAYGKFVLVKPIRRQEERIEALKKIGLYSTPTKGEGQPVKGIIHSVGGEVPIDCGFKEGDKVVFDEKSPQGFKVDEHGYIPVEYKNVLGVLDD